MPLHQRDVEFTFLNEIRYLLVHLCVHIQQRKKITWDLFVWFDLSPNQKVRGFTVLFCFGFLIKFNIMLFQIKRYQKKKEKKKKKKSLECQCHFRYDCSVLTNNYHSWIVEYDHDNTIKLSHISTFLLPCQRIFNSHWRHVSVNIHNHNITVISIEFETGNYWWSGQ